MLIAKGTMGDDTFVLLGLSRENITRLLSGQPMSISRRSHGDGVPDGLVIGIMFGETEDEMKRVLEKADIVNEQTNIFRDPRL